MKAVRRITVQYGDLPVGELAEGRASTLFQFSPEYLASGTDLSPLSMPPVPQPQEFRDRDFDRLPPLFAGSLPDSYGKRIMREWFQRQRGASHVPTSLEQLAYVGEFGLGALVYQPGLDTPKEVLRRLDLRQQERLARTSQGRQAGDLIETLRRAARTAGGTFPKALVAIDARTGH